MKVYCIQSGACSGINNMALDEALLEHVRQIPAEEPVMVARTYQWEVPTLSLGVNQPVRDLEALCALYDLGSGDGQMTWVRRPTGGRAILHGEDISFSFITNDKTLLNRRLKETYLFLTAFVRQALQALDLPMTESCERSEKAYLRSPVCFQTQTPSDLLGPGGDKLAGSAQLRRAGGVLQHGAAFLNPYGITSADFSRALFQVVAEHYGLSSLMTFPLTEIAERLAILEADYRKESAGILPRVSTTCGSHLTPASR